MTRRVAKSAIGTSMSVRGHPVNKVKLAAQ